MTKNESNLEHESMHFYYRLSSSHSNFFPPISLPSLFTLHSLYTIIQEERFLTLSLHLIIILFSYFAFTSCHFLLSPYALFLSSTFPWFSEKIGIPMLPLPVYLYLLKRVIYLQYYAPKINVYIFTWMD